MRSLGVLLIALSISASARAGSDPGPCRSDPGGVRVTLDHKAVTRGSVPAKEIHAWYRRNRTKLLYCYEKELVGRPELTATIKVELAIPAAGGAPDATATGDEVLAPCFETMFEQMSLPATADGQPAAITLELRAEQEPPRLFAPADPGCAAFPRALVKYAAKVAAAIDGDSTRKLLALLPASLTVDGVKTSKKKLGKAIAAAGAPRDWFGAGDGQWTLEETDAGPALRVAAIDRDRLLRLRKVRRAWRVVAIEDATPL